MKAAKRNNGSPAVDEQISFPSYRSFDQFIDIQRLRSLDGYLARRIERYINTNADGAVMTSWESQVTGGREIWLTNTSGGTTHNELDLERPDLWHRTGEAFEFTMLMEFIETLPFEWTSRILINYSQDNPAIATQRKDQLTGIKSDFIWFRTNLKKRFFVQSKVSGQKLYIDSYSVWFDTVDQYLGSDASDVLTFSIRVDGRFTDKFRGHIQTLSSYSTAMREELGG
jgi:hypothetical protein